jgi:hypothetical protein
VCAGKLRRTLADEVVAREVGNTNSAVFALDRLAQLLFYLKKLSISIFSKLWSNNIDELFTSVVPLVATQAADAVLDYRWSEHAVRVGHKKSENQHS